MLQTKIDKNQALEDSIKSIPVSKSDTKLKHLKPEVIHEETESDKQMYKDAKKHIFLLETLIKIKNYHKLRKIYFSNRSSENFHQIKLEFELLKNLYENEEAYCKPQKVNLEEDSNFLNAKRFRSHTSKSKISRLKSSPKTQFGLESNNPHSVKDLERTELKNKWDKFQNEMVNAQYFCDIGEETNIYRVSLRSIYLSLNESCKERNIE